MGFIWSTEDTNERHGASTLQGTRTYDSNGGLTTLAVAQGPKTLKQGTVVDQMSDGVIAWGRWTGGKVDNDDDDDNNGVDRIAALHYFTFAGQPTLPVIGSFTSFGSTAPTVTSSGRLVMTGALNSATGTVTVTLTALTGTALYSLSVPVPGQTFMLTGTALQTSSFSFRDLATVITSTGSGCAGGCRGTLDGGAAVTGTVGGTGANRAGMAYGFDSAIGNVSGVIVFKR